MLSVGDRNALALGAIIATYDPVLAWTLGCPACGAALDAELNLGELLGGTPQAAPDRSAVPVFRLPTGADLEAVTGLSDPETARRTLLRRCVDDADALSASAVSAVEEAMAAADALADIVLVMRCAQCQAEVPVPLDPVLELASRLARPAELLAEVHALALCYGWSEPEVLALSRPNRRAYLAMCADVS
jgi:hypothetical protein